MADGLTVEQAGAWPGCTLKAIGGGYEGCVMTVTGGGMNYNYRSFPSPGLGVDYTNLSTYRENFSGTDMTVKFLVLCSAAINNTRLRKEKVNLRGEVALCSVFFFSSARAHFESKFWIHVNAETSLFYQGPAYAPEQFSYVEEFRGLAEIHKGIAVVAMPGTETVSPLLYVKKVIAHLQSRRASFTFPDETTIAAYGYLEDLPVDFLTELLSSALRLSPQKVVLHSGLVLPLEVIHAILGTLLLFSPPSSFRHAEKVSGPVRYAKAAGQEDGAYVSGCPAPYAALYVCAISGFWTPPEEYLAALVDYHCINAGGRPRSAPTEYEKKLCAATGMPAAMQRISRGPALDDTPCPLHRLIHTQELYYYAPTTLSYAKLMANLGIARTAMSVDAAVHGAAGPAEARDYEESQKRYLVDMVGHAPAEESDEDEEPGATPREPSAGSGTADEVRVVEVPWGSDDRVVDFVVTPGWFSSMIGSVLVYITSGHKWLMATANLEDLSGTPCIMRRSYGSGNTDDLTVAEKRAGEEEFFIRLNKGLPLAHVPSGLGALRGFSIRRVKDGRTGPYRFELFYTKSHRRNPQSLIKHVFTHSLTFPVRYARLPPLAPGFEPVTEYPRRDVTGICEGAQALVARAFNTMSVRERRRAKTLLNHYNNIVSFSHTPKEEDRAVYRFMCALNAICPGSLNRYGLKFGVTVGPAYWNFLQQHLSLSPPDHHGWEIGEPALLSYIMPEGAVFSTDTGKSTTCLPGHPKFEELWVAYGRHRVRFARKCLNCTELPVMRCGSCCTASYCEKCYVEEERALLREAGDHRSPSCPACPEGRVAGAYIVQAPCRVLLTPKGAAPCVIPHPFSWQLQALEKLTSFAHSSEVVWLPPGAGKTLIMLLYIHWCNANRCMTKYLLWCTTPGAIPGLAKQARAAGIPINIMARSKNAMSPLLPGRINIIANTNLVVLNLVELAPILPETTFLLDEFHTSMGLKGSGTKRAATAIEIAQNAYRTIPFSGTVYAGKSSAGDLAEFLSLCVSFPLNARNFQVALGLMISYRVPSRSLVRRENVRIDRGAAATYSERLGDSTYRGSSPLTSTAISRSGSASLGASPVGPGSVRSGSASSPVGLSSVRSGSASSPDGAPGTRTGPPGQPWAETPEQAEDAWVLSTMVHDAYANAVELGKGTILAIGKGRTPRNTRYADEVLRQCLEIGLRAIVKGPDTQDTFGPSDYPDPRGPGFIYSPLSHTDEDGNPEPPNPSVNLPQVVIVVIDPSSVAGYDLNRYDTMYIHTYESNQATREQLEGRIERTNNNALIITYRYYYSPKSASQHANYEDDRVRAESIRDTQTGDDNARRRYLTKELRDQLLLDASEHTRRAFAALGGVKQARLERARASTSAAADLMGDVDEDDPSTIVKVACALIGIEFSPVPAALSAAAERACEAQLRDWAIERWATGETDEIDFATDHRLKINIARDIIMRYCGDPSAASNRDFLDMIEQAIPVCPVSMMPMLAPRTLSCGHRFDKSTLEGIRDSGRSLVCPLCRKPFVRGNIS